MGEFKIAKVMSVERRGHAVNLLLMDSLARLPMVQVMSGAASSKAGRFLLEKPTKPAKDGDPKLTKDRDVYAIVGWVNRVPMVFGFMPPQVSQMMFDRENFLIDRHPSDLFHTIDDAGNLVLHHPSGTTLLISEDPVAEDLSGLDFDEKFKIERNTTRQVHIRARLMNGGVQKADLHIDPNGNATLTLAGNLTANVTGNVSATIGGDLGAAVTGNITSSAAGWTHTGPVTFASTVTMNADLNAAGTITGTTDVVAGTKHLKAHTHSDPQGGATGGPT